MLPYTIVSFKTVVCYNWVSFKLESSTPLEYGDTLNQGVSLHKAVQLPIEHSTTRAESNEQYFRTGKTSPSMDEGCARRNTSFP